MFPGGMHPLAGGTAAQRNMPMAESYLPLEAQKEIPFLAEPIKAYRCWTLDYRRDRKQEPALRSVTYRIRWPARKEMRAHCLVQWSQAFRNKTVNVTSTLERHNCPNMRHKCGIYSLKNKDDLRYWAGAPNVVGAIRILGSALVWGRFFEYEKGYLSEFAYPLEIFGFNGKWLKDPTEELEIISYQYGIALEL